MLSSLTMGVAVQRTHTDPEVGARERGREKQEPTLQTLRADAHSDFGRWSRITSSNSTLKSVTEHGTFVDLSIVHQVVITPSSVKHDHCSIRNPSLSPVQESLTSASKPRSTLFNSSPRLCIKACTPTATSNGPPTSSNVPRFLQLLTGSHQVLHPSVAVPTSMEAYRRLDYLSVAVRLARCLAETRSPTYDHDAAVQPSLHVKCFLTPGHQNP